MEKLKKAWAWVRDSGWPWVKKHKTLVLCAICLVAGFILGLKI